MIFLIDQNKERINKKDKLSRILLDIQNIKLRKSLIKLNKMKIKNK